MRAREAARSGRPIRKEEKGIRGDVDILDYGAVPDGSRLSTAAIQGAIDACHEAGGGRVVCGPGRFLTGSLVLKSNVELHLRAGCQLIGSPNLDDYEDLVAEGFISEAAPAGNSKSLLRASGAQNIAISGPGEVNGSGLAFYDTAEQARPFFPKPATARPRMLMLYRCRDVRIEGPSFVDSPLWTFWLIGCERVAIHRVRIRSDHRMINSDGIDIDACRDVTVSDCAISTADDCIVLRSIRWACERPGACESIAE